MDDVWGNAWSQPEDDVAHHVPVHTKLGELPSWSRPPASGKHDEADVGLPSWSTGELNWTEPTGQASLWSSSTADEDVHLESDAWAVPAHSPFISTVDQGGSIIELPTPPTAEPETSTRENNSRSNTPQSAETEHPVPASTAADIDLTDHVEAVSSKTQKSRPTSPEVFGSFSQEVSTVSVVRVDGNDAWSPPEFDESADSWGSAWATVDNSLGAMAPAKDEWELAQEEKARRDRTVPPTLKSPELLQSILESLNKLTEETWTLNKDEFFNNNLGNWRNGMANYDRLDELRSKFVPESPVQPPIKYVETRVAKESNQSVKLSKNLPLVRNSPLSHLFTTKSLAAWELSVKSKKYVERDETPAGWKLPDRDEGEIPRPSLSEKKSGGILSFFNKRNSTPSPIPIASDVRKTALSRESSESSSAKANIEKIVSVPKPLEAGPSTPKTSSPLASPSPSLQINVGMPLPVVATPSVEKKVETETDELDAPAPSALSKFFNRFSRTKTNGKPNSSSPRNSMALSSEEMDFLSDIVPSHAENTTEMDSLSALTSFVSSPPIPERLPPALAPPPSLPPPPGRAPSLAAQPGPSHLRSKSQLPLLDKPAPLTQSQRVIDLMSDLSVLASSQASLSVESPSSMSPRERQKDVTYDFDLLQPSVTLAAASRITSFECAQPQSDFSHAYIPTKQLARHVSSDSIPPTPIEKSPAHTRLPPPKSLVDDDEFSDFQGHISSEPGVVAPAASDAFNILGQSSHSTISTQKVNEDFFGDFREFVGSPSSSSTAGTPTSPKSPNAGIPPPLPKKQLPANLNTLHARKSSATAYNSAVRLVEEAASKRGRWPAPESPVPPALSAPPYSVGSAASRALSAAPAGVPSSDFGLPSSARSQSIPLKSIAQITASSLSRPSSPASVASPPPVTSQGPAVGLDPLFDFTAPTQAVPTHALQRTKPLAPPSMVSTGNGKGLTEQDLSFFEGL